MFGYLGENEKALTDWKEANTDHQYQLYRRSFHFKCDAAIIMLRRKKGTIVGISSVAGERGRQSNYLYGSAKAGFTAYLSGLRNRLFHKGVHVVTVQPGFVYTSMTENLKLPALLTAKPEDVADAVYQRCKKKKNIIYVKWFWRWIMLIIKIIPEFMFKKLKL